MTPHSFRTPQGRVFDLTDVDLMFDQIDTSAAALEELAETVEANGTSVELGWAERIRREAEKLKHSAARIGR